MRNVDRPAPATDKAAPIPAGLPGRPWRAPAAALVIGFMVSAALFSFSRQTTLATRQREFDSVVSDARSAIERRILAHQEILFGLRSYFTIEKEVSRADFNGFVALTETALRNSGALALSWNPLVRKSEVGAFEESVRRDTTLIATGYPTFKVHPETNHEDLYVVTYIEPYRGNEAALGVDVGSDPTRREAIVKARDEGVPAATAPLRLTQETGQSQGFLILMPVYIGEDLPVTAPARRRSIRGFLVAVFRIDDLMAGVLGSDPKVKVEIYDIGRTVDPKPLPIGDERLLFDSDRVRAALDPGAVRGPSRSLDLNVAGRRWRMFAKPGPGFSTDQSPIPFGFGLTGVALTLLVSGLLYAFARSRRLAVALAMGMTETLRSRERELEESHSRLDSANRKLQELNQAMKDFVATAAHDLRSPLTAVLGFSVTLLKSWESVPEDQRRQYLEGIERQSRRMSTLIDDLLTLSRIEAGGLEYCPEKVEISELIRESIEYHATHDPGIRVTTPEKLYVLSDPNQLRRIIANYVSNAVKYGDPPITVEALENQRWVEIRVRDQGEGVPAEFRPRLFGKFARADTTRTREREGSGLGLSIVDGLAILNKGEVWYEPNQPKGSCFGVRLPKAG